MASNCFCKGGKPTPHCPKSLGRGSEPKNSQSISFAEGKVIFGGLSPEIVNCVHFISFQIAQFISGCVLISNLRPSIRKPAGRRPSVGCRLPAHARVCSPELRAAARPGRHRPGARGAGRGAGAAAVPDQLPVRRAPRRRPPRLGRLRAAGERRPAAQGGAAAGWGRWPRPRPRPSVAQATGHGTVQVWQLFWSLGGSLLGLLPPPFPTNTPVRTTVFATQAYVWHGGHTCSDAQQRKISKES